MLELIEALEAIKKREGLSYAQLATKLGVAENYIYRLKAGDRQPGEKLLHAIMKHYPDLTWLVIKFLQEE